MKKCTKSTNGKHIWQDNQLSAEITNEHTRKSGLFGSDIEEEHDVVRTMLPQCILCEVWDTTKKPKIETEHSSWWDGDLT